MNIYQKINEIRKDIPYIQKDKSVDTGRGTYKAITHDVVTGMIREHLIKHGVVCVPTLVKSNSEPKEEGSKQFRYVATYSFDFVNAEKPDEIVTIVIEAHAMDNADKAPGKALSYAKKYAVLKLFEIETGEDEESRFADESFPVDDHIAAINSVQNMDDLKTVFTESYQQAGKNAVAKKALIIAKDQRKEELQKGAK